MSDTLGAYSIGKDWVDLNAITGISAGAGMILQPVGSPVDLIEFSASASVPPEEFKGNKLEQYQFYEVPIGQSTIWVRYWRLDRPNLGSRTTRIQVQDAAAISSIQSPSSGSSSYDVDLALGRVAGQSPGSSVSFNPDLGTAFVDLWPLNVNYVWPTALESWEVVSDSIEDDSAGAGASTVALFCLDDSYNELPPVLVVMDGLTPVAIPGQFYRINRAIVLGGGLQGSAGTNVGNITVRRVSDQEPRRYIPASKSISQDVHFTVPMGKSLLLTNVTYYYEKNFAGNISGFIQDDTGFNINAGVFPAYQNQNIINFTSLFPIAERSDLYYRANCDNAGGRVDMSYEYVLVDNNV